MKFWLLPLGLLLLGAVGGKTLAQEPSPPPNEESPQADGSAGGTVAETCPPRPPVFCLLKNRDWPAGTGSGITANRPVEDLYRDFNALDPGFAQPSWVRPAP